MIAARSVPSRLPSLWGMVGHLLGRLLILSSLISLAASAALPPSPAKPLAATYGPWADPFPLRFTPNGGQTDPRVAYLAQGPGYSLFLTPQEAVAALTDREARTAVLRWGFVGANPTPRVTGEVPLPGRVNVVRGDDPPRWRVNLPSYGRVRYEQLYPGIDLIYHGAHPRLEYDLVIQPGADPQVIRWRIEGISGLRLDAQGRLVVATPVGSLRWRAPVAYQESDGQRHAVSSRYVLHRRHGQTEVAFAVEDYDPSHPLILDPVLEYATYLGGAKADQGLSVAADEAGYSYLTGWTQSVDFPEAGNAPSGNKDVFVACFDPTGQLVYATYLGGTQEDQGLGMATDGHGNAYVTGVTKSKDFPTVNPTDASLGGSQDAFVAKLSASGQLLYATYLGGQNSEQGAALAVDSTGQATVTGWTQSKDFPLRNAPDTVLGGSRDAFVAQLTPSGQLGYATYLGGQNLDQGTGVALAGAGQIAVTGWTQSKDFPTVNPFDATLGGPRDAFVSRFTEAGRLSYATYLGGSKTEQGAAIAADPAGHLYVAGLTQSPDLPLPDAPEGDPTATAAALSGQQDAFVAQLTPSGQLGFAAYLGGSKSDQATGLAADPWGNLYVSGWTQSKDFPTVHPTDASFGGSQDAFVAQLSTNNGAVVFATYLGGSKADQATAVATDGWGRVYVTGSTASGDFPTPAPAGATSQDTTLGGAQDAFLAVYQGDLEVPVPDVVGLTQTAAEDQITARRLTLGTVTEAYSGTVLQGHVISQDPVADILVAVGATVNLVMSRGPELITVPDVVGQLQADAQTAIENAQLTVGNVTQAYSDTVATDHVISQTPAAGAAVPKGTAVNLDVSLGPELVTVPNVVGQTQEAAQTALVSAHLTVGTVTQQTSATVPAGQVINQTPMAGAKVAKGTAVNLVVSSGSSTLPPDPSTVAPPLDPTVTTTLADATEFLYTGANPIQTGVAPGTIEEKRVAVIRGKVFDRANNPLPGVTVTVLDHPELGQTLSRADGAFDLAVNGGGVLTVNYVKSGYLPAQRQVNAPWQDYVRAEDTVLIQQDTRVTTVDLTDTTQAFQVAQGSPVTDRDGTRQATLLIPQGTQAQVYNPDGTTRPVTSLQLRLTEYTIGANGPASMPAPLPPTSAYTYAFEMKAEEAGIKRNGKDVLFDRPVPFYIDNFLNFPVGGVVPVGYYDQDKGVWVPSDNGRVIEVLAVNNGSVDIDSDGDGLADDAATLAALGIGDPERARLAGLYTAGQTLWRVQVRHLSTWDCNWPYRMPDGAVAPRNSPPEVDDTEDDPECQGGSIIECQNQTLRESLPITGTGLSINYASDAVAGRNARYTAAIPVSGAQVPASLKRIDVQIDVAGRHFEQTLPAQPNQRYTFTWDGLDGFDRAVAGGAPVWIRIGYAYDPVYATPDQLTAAFARFSGVPLEGSRARNEVRIWQEQTTRLGASRPSSHLPAGWSLSIHHLYDPANKTLYLGTGERRGASVAGSGVVSTAVGTGSRGFGGDGGPATNASLNAPYGIAVGPDSSLYIADTVNQRIRRVAPNGIITTVAGNGGRAFCGDGGPATAACLADPMDVVIAPDGSLYIADRSNGRVRQVRPDGIITTVAGGRTSGSTGDGGPATAAVLSGPAGIAVSPDGSLFIAEYARIRRVGLDGIITTVAGDGYPGFSGDGGPATAARLYYAEDVTAGTDGSVYFADSFNNRIRRVGLDGIITTVAGNGSYGFSGDGGPATAASLRRPEGLAVGPDNTLYISDSFNYRIRGVGDGLMYSLAGNGTAAFGGDGGPATAASFQYLNKIALGPDGSWYIADTFNHRIRRVSRSFPGFNAGDLPIPSADGTELYRFHPNGRHLQTLHALTGAVLYQFGYDAAGRLTSITDGDGNITTIERDADGNAAALIAPFGQRTVLSLDADGHLASVTNPAGEVYRMAYTDDGLLTELRDPKGNVSRMTYDALGRLERDTDAAGGFKALARTDGDRSYRVDLGTALGRTTGYFVDQLTTGDKRRLTTAPDGTQTDLLIGTDGSRKTTLADGTLTNVIEGPDPRFSMLAPIIAKATLVTGGLTLTLTGTRTVNLSDPRNPLSLTALTDTITRNGRTSTSVYAAATKTLTDTSAAGRKTTTRINDLGRVVQSQVTGVLATNLGYDPQGRLASLSQGAAPEERTATLGYNPEGYLDTITDALGRTAGFDYDAAGRVTRQTLPDGREILYGYDANGNLTSLTPPGRPGHLFRYTATDQTAEYQPPLVAGTGNTLHEYDLDRALTKITRPDGQSLDFGYDSAGRLSTLTIPNGELSYAYSATTGKLTGITAQDGGSLAYSYNGALLTKTAWTGGVAGSVERSYDNDFRVTSLSVNGANPVAFQYDADSLLTKAGNLNLTRSALNGLLTGTALGSLTDSYAYDGFAEVTAYEAKYGTSSLLGFEYDHDKLGRITQKRQIKSGVTHSFDYGYDTAGRLIEVKRDGIVTASYGYDDNGNRTHLNGALVAHYDDQDRLLDYQGSSYQYTANGELLSKTVGSATTSYVYDVLGNLQQVTLPNGTVIDYLIDGQNRRIGKKVNGAFVQGFLYQDQLQPIAELDGSGNVVSRFVYATGVNVPDYMVKGGATYRIIKDHLGSPRLMVDIATNTVIQEMDYDAFGRVTQDTNPGFQPFGFAGGLYDRDTKLVRFGARDYEAETGRWVAKDPILFSGKDSNLFRYVLSDPLNLTDVKGLDWTPSPYDSIFGGLGAVAAGDAMGGIPASLLFTDTLAMFAAASGGVLGAGLAGLGAGTAYDNLLTYASGGHTFGERLYDIWEEFHRLGEELGNYAGRHYYGCDL